MSNKEKDSCKDLEFNIAGSLYTKDGRDISMDELENSFMDFVESKGWHFCGVILPYLENEVDSNDDFDWTLFIKGNIAVHCDNKNKSNNFLTLCKEHNLIPKGNFTVFENIGEGYTFSINERYKEIEQASIKYYEDKHYKIINW